MLSVRTPGEILSALPFKEYSTTAYYSGPLTIANEMAIAVKVIHSMPRLFFITVLSISLLRLLLNCQVMQLRVNTAPGGSCHAQIVRMMRGLRRKKPQFRAYQSIAWLWVL